MDDSATTPWTRRLRCWLAGGDMRLLKSVRIGHKFRTIKRVPFPIRSEEVLYNKLFTLHTCLPQDVVDRFLKKFQRGGHFQSALRMLYDDWHLVETERARNRTIFTRNFLEFCQHFGFQIP